MIDIVERMRQNREMLAAAEIARLRQENWQLRQAYGQNADEIERLRAESEAAGKLADSLSDEIERLKFIVGDLQQILVDERARADAAAADIERLQEQFRQMEANRNYWMDKARPPP